MLPLAALLQTALFALAAAQNFTMPNSTAISNGTNTTAPTPSSTPSYPLTTDGSCGDQAGLTCLTNGTSPCCSSSGYCGNTPEYCDAGCQAGYGRCTPNPPALGFPACSWALDADSDAPRCDGRCGNGFGGAKCAVDVAEDAFAVYGVYGYGPCCGSSGYCGNTEEHCSLAKQCQSGCDDDTAPSSATSAAPAATSSSAAISGRIAEASCGGAFAFAVSLFGIAFAAV